MASVAFFGLSCGLVILVANKAGAAPIAMTNPLPNPFDFGEVAPDDPTPVTIAPAAGPTRAVNGNNNFPYNITVGTPTVTLTRIGSGGADSVTISSVTTSPAPGTNTGLLNGAGTQAIFYGGTRDAVAAGKAAGTYTGSYIVSVRYTHTGSAIASRTRIMLVRVLTAITIVKAADLNFGETYDGDSSLTVGPGDANSGSGTALRGPASFTISGTNSHSYNVTAISATTMTTGNGIGATKQIAVTSFVTNPTGAGGALSVGGTQTLSVGATRAAPVASQVAGSYSGSFTATVYYY